MPFLCIYFLLNHGWFFFFGISGHFAAWGRKEVAQIASAQRMKSVRDVHVVQATVSNREGENCLKPSGHCPLLWTTIKPMEKWRFQALDSRHKGYNSPLKMKVVGSHSWNCWWKKFPPTWWFKTWPLLGKVKWPFGKVVVSVTSNWRD